MTIESALLLAALAAAALVSALWRRSETRLSATQAELESLHEEREELATRLSRERQGRAKQGEELADLRKRLDKSKKRSARAEKGGGDLPLGTAARLTDLEAELERAERERDRGRAEREQLASEVATLEARLEVERRPAPAPPAPPEPPPAVATAGPSASELVEAQERIGNLQGQLELAKQSEVRMRKRLSNEEQLYASIRSELEVKKDRLRAQDERIQRLEALGVALGTDVEPGSVPDSDLDPDPGLVPDSDLDPDPGLVPDDSSAESD
jgi:chromosome segregation ATPase